MKRQELLTKLAMILALEHEDSTPEDHEQADLALLDYIDDLEIFAAYKKIRKWYE